MTCAKCGSEDVVTRFHVNSSKCDRWSSRTHSSEPSEHLHYYCRNCGFDWTGATADAG